jgi:hypothetical protein
MVNTFMVIETVERTEHLIADGTDRAMKRLQMLLFFMTFESEFGAEHLPTQLAVELNVLRGPGNSRRRIGDRRRLTCGRFGVSGCSGRCRRRKW